MSLKLEKKAEFNLKEESGLFPFAERRKKDFDYPLFAALPNLKKKYVKVISIETATSQLLKLLFVLKSVNKIKCKLTD